MKQIMILVVVMLIALYLGVKKNVIYVNKYLLHKSIRSILQWLAGVLLAILISEFIKGSF